MDRVLLVTCPALPDLFHDDRPLEAAFAARGVQAVAASWQDIVPADTPVIIRTPWDYTEHRAEFAAWLDALEAAGTPVLNPVELLRWNMDKVYLPQLEAKGHAIVPTAMLPAFDAAAVAAIARDRGWPRAIAKPTVGAGATGLVAVDADGTLTAFDASGNAWMPDASATPQGPCLVQPLMPEIQAGEWSLFYFGGRYSHAILKTPANGDIRVQEEHGGTTAAATPPDYVRGAADAIMADVADAVYGRVDGVVAGGRFLLMELELIEPELYFRYADDEAPARFVDAVLAALP